MANRKHKNNLQKIINEKNTKLEWLAYKLEMTTATVSNWCKCKTKMSKPAVMACAFYLEVEPEEIFEGYDYEG